MFAGICAGPQGLAGEHPCVKFLSACPFSELETAIAACAYTQKNIHAHIQ